MLRNRVGLCVFATVALAAPAAAQVTVAALGDSLTAGYGLPTADGFVPQMQAWLDAQGADVVLLNAGVSGDTTAGGLSRMDWTLTPDVDGVIVALGGNDYLRGLDPVVSRDNLDAILAKAQTAEVPALLVGLEAGTNYGADFTQAFNGMYAELGAAYDVPVYPDWFGPLREGDLRTYLQDDGVHPNAEGVSLIVDAMGPALLAFIENLPEG
ncbi:acyl-CoA thioesterase-1 [Loktanella fryxellensis]|uniref:Acyl-CoA thioesterase-1 n=1 Tax=Loktanella fryxellensis TaxID=245187 RepID=A0A1H8AG21_9RHOB|nr:arylesterase [Loktanella fryxellensis]SEM69705.1 acyl-CoA thioesterase-1 [Loktanella fryxellensis]